MSNSASRNVSPHRPHFNSLVSSYRPEDASLDNDMHPVIHAGRVALITGAASGIGHAAALELAKLGLKVAIADVDETKLNAVGKELLAILGEGNVLVVPTDVSNIDQVVALKDTVYDAWGEVAVLMNNAGIMIPSASWKELDAWKKIFDVNVMGLVNVQQTFVAPMRHQENPAMIINTGSKQGITNPPGNPAYNASKAAVKSLTEGLAWELRQGTGDVTAHLFVPGWTHTGITTSGNSLAPKPPGAWSAQETVLFMLDRVRFGEFYILCPDNETRPEIDHLRIMWNAADVTEGRPALSRWHPNYKSLYEEYVRENMASLD